MDMRQGTAEAQQRFDVVNACLDRLLAHEQSLLARTVRERGDERMMWERDIRASSSSRRISTVNAARNGLMFGRLISTCGDDLFIGRISVSDPQTRELLLIDWRAPVARAFYTATPLHPEGVRTRAHIRTDQVKVLDYTAEYITAHTSAVGAEESAGSSALFTALERSRTGRMGDIVATIQSEQDRIIRSPLAGALLVQGGPGTGKTVVALHRAAYLLYEHRARLERRGVLVIGPNPHFLTYIGDVLPTLGEDNVVLCTVGSLYPGIDATNDDALRAAEFKGDLRMVDVIRAAVEVMETLTEPLTVELDSQEVILVEPVTMRRMRDAARRDITQHNEARLAFERIFARLAARAVIAQRQPNSPHANDPSLRDATEDELRHDTGFQLACDRLWPVVSPEQLVSKLYADASFRKRCTPNLTVGDRELLRSAHAGEGWTTSDIPILDEARVVLGDDPRPRLRSAAREQAQLRQEREYAQGVLDILTDTTTDDTGTQGSAITADQLASRNRERDDRTLAERASADPDWVFGHVIVDEAQDLTPMALRAIIRRCPSQSMTLVGDINQAAPRVKPQTWDTLLPRQLRRLHKEQLTVNYRTPAPIMDLAANVLHRIDPDLRAPVSVRAGGEPPRFVSAQAAAFHTTIKDLIREHAEGTLGVIMPENSVAEAREFEGITTWIGTARESKGLEFDSVIIVEPAALIDEEKTGLSGLYVAMTRATKRLTVVNYRPLPDFITKGG